MIFYLLNPISLLNPIAGQTRIGVLNRIHRFQLFQDRIPLGNFGSRSWFLGLQAFGAFLFLLLLARLLSLPLLK